MAAREDDAVSHAGVRPRALQHFTRAARETMVRGAGTAAEPGWLWFARCSRGRRTLRPQRKTPSGENFGHVPRPLALRRRVADGRCCRQR
eukprot:4610873-Prymnesium_polylepis.1